MTTNHRSLGRALHTTLWSLAAAFSLACGGGSGEDTESSTAGETVATSNTSSPTGGTSETSGSGPPICGDCGDAQVCIQGECTDVPDMCPCPVETYCDLGMNKCVIGCTSDAECDDGRICDADKRECFVGCRKDVECGSGEICENLSCVEGCRDDDDCGAGELCDAMMCRLGCYTDADCPIEQLCDTEGQVCYDGCKSIDNCSSGKICKAGVCQVGCLDISWCEGGEICKDDKCVVGCLTDGDCAGNEVCFEDKCVVGCKVDSECSLGQFCYNAECTDGCGAPGGSSSDADTSRCPYGQACLGVGCDGGGNNCAVFECSDACDDMCHSSGDESYICYANASESEAFCMRECEGVSDCEPGELCGPHAYPASNPQSEVNLCRDSCSNNADCSDMLFMGLPTECTCEFNECVYTFMGFPLYCSYTTPEDG